MGIVGLQLGVHWRFQLRFDSVRAGVESSWMTKSSGQLSVGWLFVSSKRLEILKNGTYRARM